MNYAEFIGILVCSIYTTLVLSFIYLEIYLIIKIDKYLKKNEYGFKNK